MKKHIFLGFVVAILISSFLIQPAQAQTWSLSQFTDLLIKLGIIAPDKAQQARDVALNPDKHTKECFLFNRNLRIGDSGSDVQNLRLVLAKEGLYLQKDLRNDYTETVAAAVTAFQEKYGSEILAPGGLRNGTGYVGPATRAKLNKLYGCTLTSGAPVISAIEAPSTLAVGQSGTWIVKAYDPENGSLAYSVRWGDESLLSPGVESSPIMPPPPRENQTATFTHAYSRAGKYTATFTVKDASGLTVQKSVTVTVREVSRKMTVLTPNGGEIWQIGTQKNISWRDEWCNSDICPAVEPTAKISLAPYYPPCTSAVCPLYPEIAPMVIATQVYGSSYSWTIGKIVDASRIVTPGQYVIEICGLSGCDRSDKPFTIVASTSVNTPPSITGLEGPTALKVGHMGTWTIKAYDREESSLSYNVLWGDVVASGAPLYAETISPLPGQTTTFTHQYSKAGTYTVTFFVRDHEGLEAKSSMTVTVKNNDGQDLSFSVRADKASYFQGDKVKITIMAANNTSESKTLNWNNGCQVSYRIDYDWGAYDSETGMVCTQALTAVTIPAYGTKTWELIHDLGFHPIPLGTHSITGRVIGYGSAQSSLSIHPFDEI